MGQFLRSTYRLDCQCCIKFVVAGPLFIYNNTMKFPPRTWELKLELSCCKKWQKVPTKKLVWGIGDIDLPLDVLYIPQTSNSMDSMVLSIIL